MYETINKCRVCGNHELEVVFNLGVQALTGVFPKSKDAEAISGPVELVKCSGLGCCGLVQLKQSYDTSAMYGFNYGYRSGLNPSMVKHLQEKVAKLVMAGILDEGDLVIDIGSNDATTLRAYPSGRYQLVGIDPTGEKFSSYYPDEIKLVSDFFDGNVVKRELGDVKAKIITSFSMFYDLENPVTFASDVEKVLADDGIWVMEQSYLPEMLKTNSFDTICHEHLEFYGLKQIQYIADKVALKIRDVEFNSVNGGSFSVELVKAASNQNCNHEKIEEILRMEENLGLDNGIAFSEFRARVDDEREKFLTFLHQCEADGKKVAALGASTKGNVVLQYYDLNERNIVEIGEINEEKFGCFTPGSKIPMVPEQQMLDNNPDYILILPWHFKDFFVSLKSLKGRKLVFALPNFEIVTL